MLPLTLMRPGRAEDAEGFQVERESVGSQPCLSHLSSSHLHPWIALSFTLLDGKVSARKHASASFAGLRGDGNGFRSGTSNAPLALTWRLPHPPLGVDHGPEALTGAIPLRSLCLQ